MSGGAYSAEHLTTASSLRPGDVVHLEDVGHGLVNEIYSLYTVAVSFMERPPVLVSATKLELVRRGVPSAPEAPMPPPAQGSLF